MTARPGRAGTRVHHPSRGRRRVEQATWLPKRASPKTERSGRYGIPRSCRSWENRSRNEIFGTLINEEAALAAKRHIRHDKRTAKVESVCQGDADPIEAGPARPDGLLAFSRSGRNPASELQAEPAPSRSRSTSRRTSQRSVATSSSSGTRRRWRYCRHRSWRGPRCSPRATCLPSTRASVTSVNHSTAQRCRETGRVDPSLCRARRRPRASSPCSWHCR